MNTHGFTPDQARAVLHSSKTFTAWGDIEWTQHQGTHDGNITIGHTPITGITSMTFHVVLHPKRLAEPTFRLDLEHHNLQRIDVNGTHKGRRYTHLHQTNPDAPGIPTEPTDLTGQFPTVPYPTPSATNCSTAATAQPQNGSK